jgi:hypothetical protein
MLNLVSSSCPLFFEFACSVSNFWVKSHEIDKGIFVLNEKTITSAADTGNFLTVSSLDVTSWKKNYHKRGRHREFLDCFLAGCD